MLGAIFSFFKLFFQFPSKIVVAIGIPSIFLLIFELLIYLGVMYLIFRRYTPINGMFALGLIISLSILIRIITPPLIVYDFPNVLIIIGSLIFIEFFKLKEEDEEKRKSYYIYLPSAFAAILVVLFALYFITSNIAEIIFNLLIYPIILALELFKTKLIYSGAVYIHIILASFLYTYLFIKIKFRL